MGLSTTMSPEDIGRRLDTFMYDAASCSMDKKKLLALYDELVAFVNLQVSATMVHDVETSFTISSKWLRLVLHACFIHGTASAFIAVMLPELAKTGILVLGMTATLTMVYLVPVALTLPYVFHKIFADVRKEERLMRLEELVLEAKFHVLNEAAVERGIKYDSNQYTIANDGSVPLGSYSREMFNSTFLETVYLAGTLFCLGVSILNSFNVSAPVGWFIVAGVSLLFGGVYASHHNTLIDNMIQQKQKIQALSGTNRSIVEALSQAGAKPQLFQTVGKSVATQVSEPVAAAAMTS